MAAARIALALAAASLGACSMLLPRQKTTTEDSWTHFEDARAAIERIVPFQSRRAELHAARIDPYQNPAITIVNYSDLVQRFAVGPTVRADELDRGIRECLVAGKSCSGYQIEVRRIDKNRVGSFWLDTLNFKREVDRRGWTFRALILIGGARGRDHAQSARPAAGHGESMGSALIVK